MKAHEVFGKRRQKRKDEYDAASVAFRNAISKTRIYLSPSQLEGKRDKKAEAELSQVGSDTSTALRKHAKDVSDECLNIARYWANPADDPLVDAAETVAVSEQWLEELRTREVVSE